VQFEKLISLLRRHNFEIDKIEGMNWLPLPLSSNSKLVHVFEYLERNLHLKKWHSQSPWLLFSIKKAKK